MCVCALCVCVWVNDLSSDPPHGQVPLQRQALGRGALMCHYITMIIIHEVILRRPGQHLSAEPSVAVAGPLLVGALQHSCLRAAIYTTRIESRHPYPCRLHSCGNGAATEPVRHGRCVFCDDDLLRETHQGRPALLTHMLTQLTSWKLPWSVIIQAVLSTAVANDFRARRARKASPKS